MVQLATAADCAPLVLRASRRLSPWSWCARRSSPLPAMRSLHLVAIVVAFLAVAMVAAEAGRHTHNRANAPIRTTPTTRRTALCADMTRATPRVASRTSRLDPQSI